MPEVKPPRRDPAPSRLSYRLQRLALTPSVRRGFVFGLPLASIALVVGLTLGDAAKREAIEQRWAAFKSGIQQREEFLVKVLSIEGASDRVAAEIRGALPLELPASSFDLDLAAMRDRVSALDAVKSANLRVRSGGVLEIQVEERVPALVWRNEGRLALLDAQGHRTSPLEARANRGDLPLVSGEGADLAAEEAIALSSSAGPLAGRMRGLVRVGERRWTMVLDRDQSVLLPEVDPVGALEQVIALDEAHDLLGRDVVHVDMRNPNRPTVRLGEEGARAFRQTRLTQLGED